MENGWEGYYCKWKQIRRTICVTEEKIVDCIIVWMSDGSMLRHEINPDTICQFTGLVDKNGQKIWENDIVRGKTGDIFRIYWSEQLLNYSAKCVKSTFSVFINPKWDLGTLLKSQIDVEVCGNIFDNADLLEGEVMNVLEKILKEIKQPTNHTVICGKHFATIDRVEEIIRFHMNEAENDGWILCSERLPEMPEGIEDDYCPEFNVTIKGADKATTLKCAPDGTWFDDSREVYNVIAWKPLPEGYKGE